MHFYKFFNFIIFIFFRKNQMDSVKIMSLRKFIYRDVFAIRSSEEPHNLMNFEDCMLNNYFANFVVQLFKYCSVNEMITILCPYLKMKTKHFCHEIYTFANTPYNLINTYDDHVVYTRRV